MPDFPHNFDPSCDKKATTIFSMQTALERFVLMRSSIKLLCLINVFKSS